MSKTDEHLRLGCPAAQLLEGGIFKADTSLAELAAWAQEVLR